MEYNRFIGPAYKSAQKIAGADTAVNLIMEWAASRKKFVFYGRPGYQQFGNDFPDSPCRCLFSGDHRLFAIFGSTLYEVYDSGGPGPLLMGNIGASSNQATMVLNGNQLGIANGAGGVYIHTGTVLVTAKETLALGTVNTAGTTVTWVSGDDFADIQAGDTITINGTNYSEPTITYIVASVTDSTHLEVTVSPSVQTGVEFGIYRPISGSTVTFLDGRFIVSVPNSKTWRWSAVNDGLSWDPLDFEQKEGYPDNIARLLAHDRRLWIFGFESTEIWENTGDPPPASPFSRVAYIPQGTPAPYSPCELGATSIVWISASSQGMGRVMMADSIQPVAISPHELEHDFATYPTHEDAEAYTELFRGHWLYVLTFPSANITWVYDRTTSELSGERVWVRYAELSAGQYTRYRGRVHAFVQGWNNGKGRHIIGDYALGKLYEEDHSFLGDDGQVIKRERTAPLLLDEDARVTIWRIELLMQNGVIPSGSATMMFEMSWDGGKTFGNVHEVLAGSLGQYSQRVILRQAGTGRRPVLRITDTNEMESCWTDVFIRAEGSTENVKTG